MREKFVISFLFFILFLYFQSGFYLASPWNLILTKETNGFLCFHIFFCKDGERGEKKRKVETFLFLTRETIPPPPLAINFNGEKRKKLSVYKLIEIGIRKFWRTRTIL